MLFLFWICSLIKKKKFCNYHDFTRFDRHLRLPLAVSSHCIHILWTTCHVMCFPKVLIQQLKKYIYTIWVNAIFIFQMSTMCLIPTTAKRESISYLWIFEKYFCFCEYMIFTFPSCLRKNSNKLFSKILSFIVTSNVAGNLGFGAHFIIPFQSFFCFLNGDDDMKLFYVSCSGWNKKTIFKGLFW